MLRRLTVRNLAIVEDLSIELGEGLTVITGETGAGKSILVDAMALLAGGRGSSDLVREGAARLSVSGEFDADAGVRRLLTDSGLPSGTTILIRREMSADGRGRGFVEDEPTSVRTLARLGERLVAIHGQNSEQELAEAEAALELLDLFAGTGPERDATAAAADAWSVARERIVALEASRRDRAARLDSLDYQIREMEAATPDGREEEDLERERTRLAHADRIRTAGEAALSALSEDEASAADRLGEAARAFADLAAIDPSERPHWEEAEDLKRRVADLAAAARDAAGQIESDPARLTEIGTRLERLSKLKKKYGCPVAEMPELLAGWKTERSDLANIDDAAQKAESEAGRARDAYGAAADALTRKRGSAAPKLSAAVEKEIRALAMEKARFRIALTPHGEPAPRRGGSESASLLFAPNPGEPEKPVERVASGGELSRLQLAIQSVAAGRGRRGRTLVFDEVDAGIGGRTAEVVGRKLLALAAHDQVLCVTHVPQIAALADRHFRAAKSEVSGRTVASIQDLEGRERVAEIARMLAGESVPETAMKHAEALLAGARA
ncbi:MAG: DNA repair protein RecN [Acidobacteriota bacterium]